MLYKNEIFRYYIDSDSFSLLARDPMSFEGFQDCNSQIQIASVCRKQAAVPRRVVATPVPGLFASSIRAQQHQPTVG